MWMKSPHHYHTDSSRVSTHSGLGHAVSSSVSQESGGGGWGMRFNKEFLDGHF